MKAVPKQVQIDALRKSGAHAGFAYFMEMGLGKTLTALLDFQDKVDKGLASRLLVTCPNSFKGGWQREIEEWEFGYDVFIWEAGRFEDFKRWMRRLKSYPVLIINYEAIRSPNVLKMVLDYLTGSVKGSMAVFDESIQLKGHNSLQTKAAIQIGKVADFRRILTGKPIVQGPHDLWGQLRAIGHLNGQNYFAFRGAFCRLGGWQGKQVVGAQNEDVLAERIEPFIFRATKSEYAPEIPEKGPPRIREYRLTDEMALMYHQMENEFVLSLSDTDPNDNVAVEAAITKYIKLAQIQAGFIIDKKGKIRELVPLERNPRMRLLLDTLEYEVTGKFLIPYKHRHVYNDLTAALSKYNVAYITGDMSVDETNRQKDKFNNDPSCRGCLLQIDASKYGHTLLGGREHENKCFTGIFYENTYSLDARAQIEDRNHRHGQTETVVWYDLVGTPLDKAIITALQRKESIGNAVMDFVKSVSLRRK